MYEIWNLLLKTFGENFRGAEEQVLCPLCKLHLDNQELSLQCPVIRKEIEVKGKLADIYKQNISYDIVETVWQYQFANHRALNNTTEYDYKQIDVTGKYAWRCSCNSKLRTEVGGIQIPGSKNLLELGRKDNQHAHSMHGSSHLPQVLQCRSSMLQLS